MDASSKTRQQVFEVAVLLAVLVIPGTAIQLFRMDAELAQSRQRLEELSRSQDEYFKGEYLEVAAEVKNSVRELQNALTRIGQATSPKTAEFQVRTAQFNQWIERKLNRPEWERFQNQKLRERIARQKSSSTNSPLVITADLGSLLNDVKHIYETNYLAAARGVLLDAGHPGPAQTLVNMNLAKASQSAQQLLTLADEARRSGTAIEAFSNSQKPLSPPSRVVRYLLLAGLLGLFVFLILAFRCFVTSQLRVELAKRDMLIENQEQLSHFGQLAAGLAHEIRNPLTAISARLYTLQKALAEGTPEYGDSTVIRDEVHRLDRIVQDFLTLARPADPKLVPMSADPFLQKLRDLLAPQYETQAIELKVDSVDAARFRADEAQLKQVLINLIQNAAESMEKGGTITLRARKDKAQLRDHDSEVVVIEVEDTGPGIPPEVQERLFTPFFSTKESGTGLGLAIAARIVNKHGGELKFETQLNRGTTFGIVLPLYDKAP